MEPEEDRWDNIEELRRMAYEYEERGMEDFLQNLALVSDQDTITDNSDSPTLMTLHAAKGLEFNRVFIIGLDEGILPHSRSFDDPEEMAEERRLLYVGLTRARNSVTLVRAEQRMNYGMTDSMVRSRFLDDIPERLIMELNPKTGYGHRSSGSTRWESSSSSRSRGMFDAGARGTSSYSSPKSSVRTTVSTVSSLIRSSISKTESKPAPKQQTTFKALDKVKHGTFGEGVVLSVKVDGDDEVLSVQFKTVGLKKLIAGMCKLEKI